MFESVPTYLLTTHRYISNIGLKSTGNAVRGQL
jgi:hypothetical protein